MKKIFAAPIAACAVLLASVCAFAQEDDNGTAAKKFKIVLGEPSVVAQGPTYKEAGWGPFQFPGLMRTADGKIFCNFSAGPDNTESYEYKSNIPHSYVSDDQGKTWRLPDGKPILAEDWKTRVNFIARNAAAADWIDKYEPVWKSEDGKRRLYYAKDAPEFAQTLEAISYDASGKGTAWRATIDWPYMPIVYENGRVMQTTSWAALGSNRIELPNGKTYFAIYAHGFDCETGAVAYGWHYNVYVFSSDDGGRNWRYESQILTTPEYCSENHEGFCEPCMNILPDGSVAMLMRTGSGAPSYFVRSTDSCKTWSKPEKFDDVGVLPKMITLGCGVTLASYGRPGVFVRGTAAVDGGAWEPRVDLGIKGDASTSGQYSCCYTSLIPLDDRTALLAYSDFQYPSRNDPDKPVKTILVRTVTVIFESERN